MSEQMDPTGTSATAHLPAGAVTEPDPASRPSRRQVLAGLAGGVAAAALGSNPAQALAARRTRPSLPHPAESQIDHIVVLMMENRSFDHYFSWLPGADGKMHAEFPDKQGKLHKTWHLPFTQSCGYFDPDHSYEGGRIQFDHGKLDGWLRTKEADLLPIGYYEQSDLHFYGHAGPHWTVCDRYFAATMSSTYPNRFYQHAAQSDRKGNSTNVSKVPTIWDRLAGAGVSHRYYFSDIPFLALWGGKYAGISEPVSAFMTAASTGTLPHVSFVDPGFVGEGQGTSDDDHPLADIRSGQHFVSTVYNALVNSKQWDRTLLIVNYDEWGGFYDHVRPHKAPDLHPYLALRGFRVPCLVMGPRARRHHVAHQVFDHTSVLKLIEWRFGLKHLTPRDRAAHNLANVLDFSRPPKVEAPTWTVPAPKVSPCQSSKSKAVLADHLAEWLPVADLARRHGFDLPSHLS